MAVIKNIELAKVLFLSQFVFFVWCFCGLPQQAMAHPMPNSLVRLKVLSNCIRAEIQIPLSELVAAWGINDDQHPALFFQKNEQKLRRYLVQHIRPMSMQKVAWKLQLDDLILSTTENPINGKYYELVIYARIYPPKSADLRRFIFDYDVVVHQVITHTIVVSVQQDWAAGNIEGAANQLGTIQLDIPSGKIKPLVINLAEGSTWAGFSKMLHLGMDHIASGTDHLLFLFALLLSAPLISIGKKWGAIGDLKYSLWGISKIVTAFTIGHSLTLFIGGLRWMQIPSQPIEILIAVSILVAALHAIQPIFASKEIVIAAGFGLIHGLAFANTLIKLDLDFKQIIISLLGFNIGIELMQLMIIVLTMPTLVLLSRCRIYSKFRIGMAILIATVALAWMTERISGQGNSLTQFMDQFVAYAPLVLLLLTVFALLSYWLEHQSILQKDQNPKNEKV